MAATPSSSGRRQFLRFVAVAPFAAFALGTGRAAAQATAGATSVCPVDDEPMRESLNYLAVSPYSPTKDCTNCKLWSAPAAGATCGGCTLIEGAIDPHGYCDSWAPIGSAPSATAAPATQSG